MDAQTYSRLLSYVFCEMTMPIKKHVYNFAVSNQLSIKPQLISAAAHIATSQSQVSLKHKNITSELTKLNNRNMSHLTGAPEDRIVENEVQELCEGTEIEKSALGDLLNYGNPDENLIDEQSTSTPIHEYGNFLTNTTRKRHNPENEDSPSQPVLKKIKDECPVKNEDSEGFDTTENESVSNVNNKKVSLYSAMQLEPLLSCSANDFKSMYKVSRSTFQIIVEILSEEELEPIEDVPLHKKILIVLWLLGNSGSYKDAAEVFGVSEEAVSSCFYDICATLYNKSDNFIKWPSSDECEEIASRIETNFGFPGVVGILGCQYFTITIPKESLSRREHFNGKLRMYCVALQVVCDDEYVIRDVFPGLPGSVRPAQVLRESPLGEVLNTQPTELIEPNKHILASSEFPQLTSMLTPYIRKGEALTKEEDEFNALHVSVCALVDRTFKLLKERFRILKLLDPETATMVLVTTCVLHNICVQNGDTFGDVVA